MKESALEVVLILLFKYLWMCSWNVGGMLGENIALKRKCLLPMLANYTKSVPHT